MLILPIKTALAPMTSPAFSDVPAIVYEGPQSRNPLAFKHYNASEIIDGKTMREHLRFSVTYWHTFRGTGSDPFGPGTMLRPWDDGSPSVENAQKRARVAFEFFEKLGAPFYAFHDRDVAPEGGSLAATNPEPGCRGRRVKRRADTHGRRPALGHGEPVHQPALCPRRGDQPERGRVRLRGGAGEKGHRGHARTRRPGLHVLGRGARVIRRSGTRT